MQECMVEAFSGVEALTSDGCWVPIEHFDPGGVVRGLDANPVGPVFPRSCSPFGGVASLWFCAKSHILGERRRLCGRLVHFCKGILH